jgi:hypothetical protein
MPGQNPKPPVHEQVEDLMQEAERDKHKQALEELALDIKAQEQAINREDHIARAQIEELEAERDAEKARAEYYQAKAQKERAKTAKEIEIRNTLMRVIKDLGPVEALKAIKGR